MDSSQRTVKLEFKYCVGSFVKIQSEQRKVGMRELVTVLEVAEYKRTKLGGGGIFEFRVEEKLASVQAF